MEKGSQETQEGEKRLEFGKPTKITQNSLQQSLLEQRIWPPHNENRYGSPCYTAMEHHPEPHSWDSHQGCYSKLLPASRWAAVVVHRPGKGGGFLQETTQGPKPELFIPLEASGQPASESVSTWMPGQAGQGGPSLTAPEKPPLLLSAHTFIFSFANPSSHLSLSTPSP